MHYGQWWGDASQDVLSRIDVIIKDASALLANGELGPAQIRASEAAPLVDSLRGQPEFDAVIARYSAVINSISSAIAIDREATSKALREKMLADAARAAAEQRERLAASQAAYEAAAQARAQAALEQATRDEARATRSIAPAIVPVSPTSPVEQKKSFPWVLVVGGGVVAAAFFLARK